MSDPQNGAPAPLDSSPKRVRAKDKGKLLDDAPSGSQTVPGIQSCATITGIPGHWKSSLSKGDEVINLNDEDSIKGEKRLWVCECRRYDKGRVLWRLKTKPPVAPPNEQPQEDWVCDADKDEGYVDAEDLEKKS